MEKFKVGDKVKVRDWDDMVKEYGVNDKGYIQTPKYPCLPAMRSDCGKVVTITDILYDGYGTTAGDFTNEVLVPVNNKEVDETMKLHIGDKVKVREWDDMANEYGVDGNGDIEMSTYHLLHERKKYCGQVVTIQNIDRDGDCEVYIDGEYRAWFPKESLVPVTCRRVVIRHDVGTEWNGKLYNFIAKDNVPELKADDIVVVDTVRGLQLGTVVAVTSGNDSGRKEVVDKVNVAPWEKRKRDKEREAIETKIKELQQRLKVLMS